MSYDNELYQQVILDHNRKPRNFHEMENPTNTCHGINPLCGDDITVYLEVDEAGGVIRISVSLVPGVLYRKPALLL